MSRYRSLGAWGCGLDLIGKAELHELSWPPHPQPHPVPQRVSRHLPHASVITNLSSVGYHMLGGHLNVRITLSVPLPTESESQHVLIILTPSTDDPFPSPARPAGIEPKESRRQDAGRGVARRHFST
jgi:hypothetical protein